MKFVFKRNSKSSIAVIMLACLAFLAAAVVAWGVPLSSLLDSLLILLVSLVVIIVIAAVLVALLKLSRYLTGSDD
jgi:hypothetical protein